MGALGILAAVAVLVGGVHTTMVATEENRLAAEANKQPIVEVQAIQQEHRQTSDDSKR